MKPSEYVAAEAKRRTTSNGAKTAKRQSASSTRPKRAAGTAAAARAAAIGNYRRRKQIITGDNNKLVDPDELGAAAAVNKTGENKSNKSADGAQTAIDVYAEDKTQVQDVNDIPPEPIPPPVQPEVVAIKPTGEIKEKSKRLLAGLPRLGKSKKKKEKPVDNREHFFNEGASKEFTSPDSKSPTMSEGKIHDIIYDIQLSGTHYQWEGSFRRRAVLFTCTFGFMNFLHFPQLVYNYGGIFFLIPYSIMMILIAMPMAFLELSIGQFTSLHPSTLFVRMAPCFTGIGYSMTFLRIVMAWIFYSPRILFEVLNSIFTIFMDPGQYGTCDGIRVRDCYESHIDLCPEGEIQYHGKCYDLEKEVDAGNMTFEQATVILTSTSAALRTIAPAMFLEKYFYQFGDTFSMSASFYSIMMFAVVLIAGHRVFSNLAIVLSSTSIFMVVFMFGVQVLGGHYSDAFEFIVPGDYTKLGEFATWREAAIQALGSLSIADGTLIFIGSMSKFENSVAMDVVFVAIADIIMNILCTLVVIPIMLMFANFHFSNVHEFSMTDRQRIDMLPDQWGNVMLHYLVPFYGIQNYGGWISLVILIGAFATIFANQILAAEMFLKSLYHTFPSLYSINQTHFRHFFGVIYMSTFLAYCLLSTNPLYEKYIRVFIHHYLVKCTIPIIALFELTSIMYHYKFRRIMVNLKTMFKEEPGSFLWNYYFFSWLVIIPLALIVIIITQIVPIFPSTADIFPSYMKAIGYILCIAVSGLVVWVFLVLLAMAYFKRQNIQLLFEPHKNWGPQLSTDRRHAEYDERAARVRG